MKLLPAHKYRKIVYVNLLVLRFGIVFRPLTSKMGIFVLGIFLRSDNHPPPAILVRWSSDIISIHTWIRMGHRVKFGDRSQTETFPINSPFVFPIHSFIQI